MFFVYTGSIALSFFIHKINYYNVNKRLIKESYKKKDSFIDANVIDGFIFIISCVPIVNIASSLAFAIKNDILYDVLKESFVRKELVHNKKLLKIYDKACDESIITEDENAKELKDELEKKISYVNYLGEFGYDKKGFITDIYTASKPKIKTIGTMKKISN